MTGIKLSILILSVFLTFASCQRTCENVKIGEVDFSSTTKSFLLYQNEQELTFQNKLGRLIAFKVMRSESDYFICQKITCRPLDPYKSSYCEYIESPSVEIILQTDSLLLVLNAGIFAYDPESPLLYDAVRFSVSYINESLLASHITNIGFDNPPFNQEHLQDVEHFALFQENLMLEEKTYENVHYYENEHLAFYFAEGIGFVAFKIKDELFTLQ